jgi:DNA polymerase-3 subunit delta'
MPLSAVIGHAPVIALLRQAVGRHRVPQSLIFAGPEGVGKRAVALALAQAVNCPERAARGPKKAAGDDGCGVCSTCQRIARGIHSDVVVVDKGDEASIKIAAVRERVLQVVGYRPFEAARRVFIIDPADEMGVEAQDALLKTLEEPPPSAILILITAYPDTLLPTIQSRCRRLRFGPLSEADVARVLVERAGVDNTKARALAAVSAGSVGRALAAQEGELDQDRDAAFALVAAARGTRVTDRLKAAAAFAKNDSDRRDRDAMGDRLALVGSILRDLGALAAGRPGLLANADREADLRALASAYDVPRVVTAYGALARAQASLDRNAGPKIVADWVAVTI